MGGMDGVEAMKRIRTDVSGLNGSIPIVALTANAMSSAKQMFLAEGFDGFVSKPVEIEELERVLKQVLPKSAITYEEKYADISIEEAPEPEEVKVEEKLSDEDVFAQLKKIGIDTDAGIKYCVGDQEFYKSLLLQFANETSEKIPSLKKYFHEHDWHNYEIIVHALKSTSKMIGIMDLSEEAKALEMAAKEQKAGFITENHEQVLMDYSRYAAEIKEKLNAGSDDDDEVFEFEPEDEGGYER